MFVEEDNINVLLVEEGLAIAMIYDQGRYSTDIMEAEEYAMNEELGCKWSA